jgi:pyruvate-ferredoxin/flavodoxin oxidoreductase
VAQVALGAKDNQVVRAFLEADSYRGPSLILAYAHCIAHGYNLVDGLDHQQMAVDCGAWPLYRFDPRRTATGENPLKLDSSPPKLAFEEYAMSETRFRMLVQSNPERARRLLAGAEQSARARFRMYEHLAQLQMASTGSGSPMKT